MEFAAFDCMIFAELDGMHCETSREWVLEVKAVGGSIVTCRMLVRVYMQQSSSDSCACGHLSCFLSYPATAVHHVTNWLRLCCLFHDPATQDLRNGIELWIWTAC